MRVAVVIFSLLVITIAGIGVWLYTGGPFREWRHQMGIGATYMNSLKGADVSPWIERTKRLLAEWRPDLDSMGVYGFGDKPVPADLQQLGIVRIDILQDQIRYVWMGGMDHTELEVDRLPDGTFRIIAHYNDYKSEIIWPKEPNQTMQRNDAACSAHAAVSLGYNRTEHHLS